MDIQYYTKYIVTKKGNVVMMYNNRIIKIIPIKDLVDKQLSKLGWLQVNGNTTKI